MIVCEKWERKEVKGDKNFYCQWLADGNILTPGRRGETGWRWERKYQCWVWNAFGTKRWICPKGSCIYGFVAQEDDYFERWKYGNGDENVEIGNQCLRFCREVSKGDWEWQK